MKFDDQASPALPAAFSDPRLQRRHDVASGMLHLVSMLSAHYNNVLLLPIQTTADAWWIWVASDATLESTPDEDQVLSKKWKTRSRDVNAAMNMERV
ncbi:hypothetical protein P3T76_003775 [Phytophthora citrophthora]|uniref:Uncharacterized protein n=1 Tax=Phytophthora citrophthora TaxID=4793 RepID=A0AAD9GUW8_9STRA|nr:hypothetical protein P3T76_003775 [Phytophthora citrophthora]